MAPDRQDEALGSARRWPAWLPPALLALLVAVMFWPLLAGGRVPYWGTPLLQFYPWRTLAADMLRAGALPLWMEGVGNGAPLLANHQTAAYYPLNVLFLIWPAEQALGYSAALHVLLAGVGMWLLARALRLSRFAAAVGAIAYMFSAFIITRLNFPSMTSASAWMPYLWLCAERLVVRRRLGDTLALGVVVGLQFLAGHAQLWYYSLWALGLYVVCRIRAVETAATAAKPACAGYPSRRRQASRRLPRLPVARLAVILLALSAVLLGSALAAAQLLPTAELALQSQRQAGAEYDFAMTYSFWPWRLITFFAPDFFGTPARGDYWGYANYWEDAGYVGVLPLLLLAPAILAWWRSRRVGFQPTIPVGRRDTPAVEQSPTRPPALSLVPFLLGLILISLALALGKNTPLYPLVFRHVPGFGFFQAPARFLYWTTIALALLAAIGADQALAWRGRGKAARLLIVAGVGLFLAGLTAQIALASVKNTFGPALMRAAGLLIASSAPLALSEVAPGAGWRRIAGRIWPGLAILVLATDLLAFGRPFNPTTTPAAYHAPNRTAALLQAQTSEAFRIYTFDEAEYDLKFKRFLLFRDFGDPSPEFQTALRETLIPEANLVARIDSAGHFDSLLVGRYKRLMERVNAADAETALRLLGLMNVAYVVQPDAPAGLAQTSEVFGDFGSLATHIYGNATALPRAWWVPGARCVADGDAALEAISRPDFDPRREVVLEQPCESGAGSGTFTGAAALRYRPNGVTIDLNAPAAGYLVLADTWYPGWQASVNGKPAAVLRANYAFRAVAVPAGTQVVDFTYAPLSARLGLIVSAVAWAGVLAVWIVWGVGRRRRPADVTLQA